MVGEKVRFRDCFAGRLSIKCAPQSATRSTGLGSNKTRLG
jgi:hypothetical protein